MFFGFGKRNKEDLEGEAAEAVATAETQGLFQRLKRGLARTRSQFGAGLSSLLRGRKAIDDELLEELETLLLTADVGVEATSRIIGDLTARAKRHELGDADALLRVLREQLLAILRGAEAPVRSPAEGRPQVILMVGVNGAGKTTTIGKLAKRMPGEGQRVMLAAGDTFRAAAVEQLQAWGDRNHVPVIASTAVRLRAVIFDAIEAAARAQPRRAARRHRGPAPHQVNSWRRSRRSCA